MSIESSANTESRGIDQSVEDSLMRALWGLLGYWKVILAAVICAWIAGAVLFVMLERQYQSVVLLKPLDESGDGGAGSLAGRLGGVAALAGIDLSSSGASVDVAIATLQSRKFLTEFIVDRNLWADLFPDRWDESRNTWKVDEPNRPTLQDAYSKLADALRITRDRQTNLVTVALTWRDPQKAADWLTTLIARLNAVMRAQAEEEARKNLRFLNEELERTPTLETRQSIYRMIEMQVNKAMLANVREDYAFGVIDPAIVPDSDKYVSPNKVLVAFLSTLIGLLLGVLAAVVLRLRAVK